MPPQDASINTSEQAATVDPATQAAAVIPVTGKNADAVAKLAALDSPLVQMREVPFHFKTPRSEKKNDKGEPVDELGEVLKKRETIKLNLPMPTFAGIVEAMQDEKQLAFITDLIEEAIIGAARDQVGDDSKPVNSQDELDISKLTLAFIANQPKAERRGGGIGKEVWEEFAKDYVEIMPAIANKSPEAVGNASKLFLAKFQPVKTQKKVIAYLQQQLALWFQNTKRADDFSECYEFLNEKATNLLKQDEAALLDTL